MMELDVRNEKGEVTGKVLFDESILGDQIRPRLLHQVTVAYMANLRQGNASAKTKADCAGSNKKPWRQKHTGRARAGDRRSPLWSGGGVVFPPKPREYRQHVTRSMGREALRSALLSKFRDKQVTVIEPLVFEKPRTKRVASMLRALRIRESCLIALAAADRNLWKSSRNLAHLSVLPATEMNALEVLKHRRLVMTREVVERLGEFTHLLAGARSYRGASGACSGAASLMRHTQPITAVKGERAVSRARSKSSGVAPAETKPGVTP